MTHQYRIGHSDGIATSEAEYAATLAQRLINASTHFTQAADDESCDAASFNAAERAEAEARAAMRAELRGRLGLSDAGLDKLVGAL